MLNYITNENQLQEFSKNIMRFSYLVKKISGLVGASTWSYWDFIRVYLPFEIPDCQDFNLFFGYLI